MRLLRNCKRIEFRIFKLNDLKDSLYDEALISGYDGKLLYKIDWLFGSWLWRDIFRHSYTVIRDGVKDAVR